MWQEIYVYIPEPKKEGIPLTIRFNSTKQHDKVTELYMAIDWQKSEVSNSRKLILPNNADDEQVNKYIIMLVANISSLTGTTSDQILEAMDNVIKNKIKFEELSQQYRKELGLS